MPVTALQPTLAQRLDRAYNAQRDRLPAEAMNRLLDIERAAARDDRRRAAGQLDRMRIYRPLKPPGR